MFLSPFQIRGDTEEMFKEEICESVVENEQEESNCKFSPTVDH